MTYQSARDCTGLKGARYLINRFVLLFQRHDILEAINNLKTEEPFFPRISIALLGFQASPVCPSDKSSVKMCVWSIGGMIVQGKIKVIGEKSVPLPHCSQIPPALARNRTQASTLRGQRLTA